MIVGSDFLVAHNHKSYALHCTVKSNHSDGSVVFYVNNGAWTGRLTRSGDLIVRQRGVWCEDMHPIHAVTPCPPSMNWDDAWDDLAPPEHPDLSALRPNIFAIVYARFTATLTALRAAHTAFKNNLGKLYPELTPPPNNEPRRNNLTEASLKKPTSRSEFDALDDDIPF
jgi:hypothetical protein